MQIDFNKLSEKQIDLIIDRLNNKFDNYPLEEIEEVANFIEYYRIKRFESGLIKILEGDEILKGKVYGVSKTKEKKKEVVAICDENTEDVPEENDRSFNEQNDINKDSLKNRVAQINRLRAASIGQENFDNETKNNNIVLGDNIEQIESKFSLREINEQLPSETLLDKYNLSYINLRDDDDAFPKENLFRTTARRDVFKTNNKK